MKRTTSLFLLFFLFISVTTTHSQTLENSDVKLELNPSISPTINISKSKNNYQNKSINAAETISGDGYTIKISYPNDRNRLPLGLSISQDKLSFGTLESGEALIRTLEAEVFKGSTPNYTLFAAENDLLTTTNNAQIPNTTCDGGNCTYLLSDLWNLPLTYGLGYTCIKGENHPCSTTFSNSKYRRFANLEANEPITALFTESKDVKSSISVKVNISQAQPQGAYKNTLHLLLSPQL